MIRRRKRHRKLSEFFHDGETLFAENTLYIEPNRINENRFASRSKGRIDLFSEDHIVIETRKGFYHVSINKKARYANNSAIKTGKYKRAIYK